MLKRNKFKFPNELSKSKRFKRRFLHTKIFPPSHDLLFDTDEMFGMAGEEVVERKETGKFENYKHTTNIKTLPNV